MPNLRNCSAFILKQSISNILSTMGAIDANVGQTNFTVRTFSRTSRLAKSKNFYDDLEVPRTATQSEIKCAYYELSMAYHPDKNKTEHAKTKFRLITEAYEVLGNVRTRRMYDKGIGSAGSQSAAASPGTESEMMYEDTDDDPQTKFYKQHMVKSQPPTMAGRPTARDFDDYAAQLTTKSFHQLQRARNSRREREDDIRVNQDTSKSYSVMMSIACAIFTALVIYEIVQNRAHEAELRRIKLLNENKKS